MYAETCIIMNINICTDSIAVSVFVVILVDFDKYRIQNLRQAGMSNRISCLRLAHVSDLKTNCPNVFFIQDLFHLLDANGGDTASQEELVKAGKCFFFSPV